MPAEPTVPTTVDVAPGLLPARTFDTISGQVVRYLQQVAPLGLWAVTRVNQGRQVMLQVEDTAYGFARGAEIPFADSPCHAMVAGTAPQIAPDAAAVPGYADCGVASVVPLGAYAGTPILRGDGELFGTVCGFHPTAAPDALRRHQPLLDLLSSLLSAVLDADAEGTALARELEQVRTESETDALTGLTNRRGWDQFLEREEERYRRFGDAACVVVLDLDRLKVVNDTQGHDAGDRYIQRAADTLREVVRAGDVLARLGGDEFGIVAVGAGQAQAADLVERAGRALEAAGVSGSFGHAPYSVVAGFPGAWKAADAAMYEAKRLRRTAG